MKLRGFDVEKKPAEQVSRFYMFIELVDYFISIILRVSVLPLAFSL